ncbi:MAG TPA: SulP family inorganic anion transporter [Jiangellaceae bacterium]
MANVGQQSSWTTRWRDHVPALRWLRAYDRHWLRSDIAAGVTIAALAIPQALGYATIAGVPVEVGLYAIPPAMLAYALMGSSPQLVVGPVSTVSVLSGSMVASLRPVDEAQAVAYTAALALGAGLVLVAAGLLRIGWVAEFLSKPIVTGFVIGLTLLVIVGEVPKLLGIPAPQGDVLDRVQVLLGNLGASDALTAAIGIGTLAILFGGARLVPHVPWALVVVVGSIVASSVLNWSEHGVAVVGAVQAGLPQPGLPGVPLSAFGTLLVSGAALALVGIAEGLSAARLFATKGGYEVDADQELVATGAANLTSGLFGGIAVAGSLSKTATAVRAEGRTQVAGIATAALTLLAILAVTPLLAALPLAVLSAVVVHAVWGLIDRAALERYRSVRRLDFLSAIVAVIGVLVFGPLIGLLLAVAQSVLGLVYRSTRVDVERLGRIPGEKAGFGTVHEHGERLVIEGLLVARVGAPLFWVNAATVRDQLVELVERTPGTKALIIDLGGTSQLDTTSADTVAELVTTVRSRGVDVYFVRVMFAVRDLLRRSGTMAVIGEDHVWHSISYALKRAREAHGIDARPMPLEPDSDKLPPGVHPYGYRRSSREDEHGHLEVRGQDS